jgi:hypothetical protein
MSAVSNLPIFPQNMQAFVLQLTNAIGTTVTTVVTGGANGTLIESLNVSSTDATLAHTFQVYLSNGTTAFLLGSVNVPISAGNVAGTPAVDFLRSGAAPGLPVDVDGNFVIYVPSGFTLQVSVTVAVTTADFVEIVALGVNY